MFITQFAQVCEMLSFGVITKVNTLVRQRQKELNKLVVDWGGGGG